MSSKIYLAALTLLAFILVPTFAIAQDAGSTSAQPGIVLEESVITGRLQKPEAFYFLKNAELGWEKLHHERSFIRGIETTIYQDPF